jgi:hypothetical protein
MLTGIYLMHDACYYTVDSGQSSPMALADVPITEPTDLAELLHLKMGMQAKLSSGSVITAGGQIPGEKVWAAQWRRVAYEPLMEQDWATEAPDRLRLVPFGTQILEEGPDEAKLIIHKTQNLMDYHVQNTLADETDAWQEFEDEAHEIEEQLLEASNALRD